MNLQYIVIKHFRTNSINKYTNSLLLLLDLLLEDLLGDLLLDFLLFGGLERLFGGVLLRLLLTDLKHKNKVWYTNHLNQSSQYHILILHILNIINISIKRLKLNFEIQQISYGDKKGYCWCKISQVVPIVVCTSFQFSFVRFTDHFRFTWKCRTIFINYIKTVYFLTITIL